MKVSTFKIPNTFCTEILNLDRSYYMKDVILFTLKVHYHILSTIKWEVQNSLIKIYILTIEDN